MLTRHKFLSAVAFVTMCVTPLPTFAAGTLAVDLKTPFISFVQDESIPMKLTVQNFASTTYIVDDYGDHDQNRIEIRLKHSDLGYLPRKGGDTSLDTIMIMPRETKSFEIDLNKLFILRPSSYLLQIIFYRGEEQAASQLIKFDIVPGLTLGTVARPLEGAETISRTYTLVYWPRNKIEALFLRVTDSPNDHVIGMFQLGNILRFEPPRIAFADNGQVIILHQSSQDILIRTTLRSTASSLEVINRERLFNDGVRRTTDALTKPTK